MDLLKMAEQHLRVLQNIQGAVDELVEKLVSLKLQISEAVGEPGEPEALKRLSKREREVFVLIQKRLGTSDIAGKLGTNPKTVHTQKLKIREKLGLPDNRALDQFAERLQKT